MLSTDEIYEIMIYLDIDDLYTLCHTNSIYRDLCQDEKFWKKKISHENMIMTRINVPIKNWFKFYKVLKEVSEDIGSMGEITKRYEYEHEYSTNNYNTFYFVNLLNQLNINHDLPMIKDDKYVEFAAWYTEGNYVMEFMVGGLDIFIHLNKYQFVSFLFQAFYDNVVNRIA